MQGIFTGLRFLAAWIISGVAVVLGILLLPWGVGKMVVMALPAWFWSPQNTPESIMALWTIGIGGGIFLVIAIMLWEASWEWLEELSLRGRRDDR